MSGAEGAAVRPGPGEVQVWRVPLDPSRPPAPESVAILSDAERARAARFVRDTDRNRWLHSHVALRRILAAATGLAAERLAFAIGPHGKPALVPDPAMSQVRDAGRPAAAPPTALEFNLSDSGDLALVAVSGGGPVGVDVEACRPQPDLAAIAESHFAPAERVALLALPEGERHAAFYRIWTRKEAYLKALGVGIGYGLARFAVTLDARDARLLSLDGDEAEGSAWSFAPIAVPSGYEGVVATRWPSRPTHLGEWPGV